MTPILVTGADGRVGRTLMQSGFNAALIAFDGDVTKPDDIARAMDEHAPAAIINLAATTLPSAEKDKFAEALQVNARALNYLEDTGLPIVHISTDCVFDGEKIGAYTEDDACNPRNNYGLTKRVGECTLDGGPHIIIRTTGVFLAGRPNFVETVLQRARKGETLEIVSDSTFTPTDARELAKAILIATEALLIDRSFAGTYHFAGSEGFSYLEWAQGILAAAKFTAPIHPVTMARRELTEGFKRPRNACLNSDKFAKTFGYRHRPLDDCLHEVVNAALVTA